MPPDVRRRNDFLNFVEYLKSFLRVPKKEKVQIYWGSILLSKQDLYGNWNQVSKVVPLAKTYKYKLRKRVSYSL